MMDSSDEEILCTENIAHACKLLNFLAKNNAQYNSPMCRPLRAALQPLFEQQQERMFGGKTLKEHKSELQKKKRAESMKSIQRQEDKKLLENTQLRADRMKRLIQIDSQDGVDIPLIEDGVGNDGLNVTDLPVQIESEIEKQHTLVLAEQVMDGELTTSNSSSNHTTHHRSPAFQSHNEPLLNKFRSCYVCKRRFSQLHHFYHSLCPYCAQLNWTKRMQMCDMRGRICLVTGGRVKIGFQCCLKLLRCGATVISTSRFPVDAASRFASQRDFPEWRERVICIGLDLRNLPYLEFVCQQLIRTFNKLDVIINNACQTIRRPREYYSHMMELETRVLSDIQRKTEYLQLDHSLPIPTSCGQCKDVHSGEAAVKGMVVDKGDCAMGAAALSSAPHSDLVLTDLESVLLYDVHTKRTYDNTLSELSSSPVQSKSHSHNHLQAAADAPNQRARGAANGGGHGEAHPSVPHPITSPIATITDQRLDGGSSGQPATLGFSSADMSQLALIDEDVNVIYGGGFLPAEARDVNGQQIDLRRANSWVLRTHEVQTPEVAEVFAINSIAPFVLISRLKGMLMAGKEGYDDDLAIQRAIDGVSGSQKRSQMQKKITRLRTLNEFIMESLQATANAADSTADGSCPSMRSTTQMKHNSDVDNCDDDHDKKDAWSNSRANHRGTVLEAVSAKNCSFVVNVSSMEGKFYRPKTEAHPHTNMAKAALNMLTRTSAGDYQRSNIYMTAVDTGWINDENPLEKAAAIACRHDFSTPLDEVDAAARILDPIISSLRAAEQNRQHYHQSSAPAEDTTNESAASCGDTASNSSSFTEGYCAPPFGCFLKDYFISEW